MEPESVTNHTAIPVRSSERYVILDVLRGLALLGIALANFPEFSLYSFLSVEAADVMPTAGIDRIVRYLQYIFIDGNRCFKVTGLFLLGFCIGRNRLYADLSGLMPQLKRIACYGFIVGVPLSFIYAWSAMNGRPWGLGMHAVLYFTSVFRWVSPTWPVYAFVTFGVRNGKVSVSPPCRDAWPLPIISGSRYSVCCFSTASGSVLVPVWDWFM